MIALYQPRGRIAVTGLLLAIALALTTPLHASAHALLLSSEPADGQHLGIAPSAVIFNFSEALNPSLSQATVQEANGSATTAHSTTPLQIRADLLTNSPGLYTVNWTAVSSDDGHTTHGTLSFTVEARASAASNGSSTNPSGQDIAIAVARWVEDFALLLALGMVFVRWLVRDDQSLQTWVTPRLRPVVVSVLVAGIVVIFAEALTATEGNLANVGPYFLSGESGIARIARLLFELNAVGAVSTRARRLAIPIIAPLIALAASGHASGNAGEIGGIAIDAGHLLTAGMWAGGILAMATLRPPEGWRAGGIPLLRRFTPWALGAFATTVALGGIQAVLNLGSWSALTGTEYGQTLIIKASLVLLMIPLSLIAWRLRRPRLRIEGGIAVAVIAAAALLASSPVPARLSAAPTGTPGAAAGLPHGSVVTLAQPAGKNLVGVTITPGRPGTNSVTVYVLPPEGVENASFLVVDGTINGRPLTLSHCGDPCRSGTANLSGGENLSLEILGFERGLAQFTIPPFPARDASSLIKLSAARMHALSSYAMHETLTSGGPTTISTAYIAQSPDRLEWTTNGERTIDIGNTQYSQANPSAPWQRQPSPTVPEPTFVWDNFTPYVGNRVLGSDVIDGHHVTIVGFFGGSAATPIWFRLWIDDTGLVYRAVMYAPGHFMNEDFSQFDTAATIAAPSPAAQSLATA